VNYDVTLATTNVNGSRSLTRDNYVMFGGSSLPFNENWESASLAANGWEIINPDDKKTWEFSPVQGNSPGNTAIRMDYYAYNVAPGPRDQLISPPINLTGYNSAFLTFEHAYCKRYAQITDSLIIQVSEDCGTTWTKVTSIGEDGTGNFETHPVSIIAFVPETADDWCGSVDNPGCFLVDLSPWVGKSNIKVMFESVHRRGNGLYIDNINISEVVSVQPETIASDGLRVYPNPTQGSFTVENEKIIHSGILQIYSSEGLLVHETSLTAGNQWTIHKSGLKPGLYILRIISNDQVKKIKLLID
jgi:hypothetical protein